MSQKNISIDFANDLKVKFTVKDKLYKKKQ